MLMQPQQHTSAMNPAHSSVKGSCSAKRKLAVSYAVES